MNLEFRAQVEVAACDERGVPSLLKLKVDALRPPLQDLTSVAIILPRGTEVTARSAILQDEPRKYADVFAGPDGPVDPLAVAALRRVITIGGETESTEQQAFGTDKPMPIGGSWTLDGERGAALLAKMHVDADPTHVTGTAQIARVVHLGTVECLEVRLTAMADECNVPVSAGKKLLRSNATGHLTYYLDKATGRIVGSHYDVQTYCSIEGKKDGAAYTDRHFAKVSRDVDIQDVQKPKQP